MTKNLTAIILCFAVMLSAGCSGQTSGENKADADKPAAAEQQKTAESAQNTKAESSIEKSVAAENPADEDPDEECRSNPLDGIDMSMVPEFTFKTSIPGHGDLCFITLGYNVMLGEFTDKTEFFFSLWRGSDEYYMQQGYAGNDTNYICTLKDIRIQDANQDGLTDIVVIGECPNDDDEPLYSNMVYFNTGEGLDFYTASEFNYHLDYDNADDLIAGIGQMDLKEFMATYEM